MKKQNILYSLLPAAFVLLAFCACKQVEKQLGPDAADEIGTPAGTERVNTEVADEIPTHKYLMTQPEYELNYLVASLKDEAAVYKKSVDPAKALIVISKREYRLYVYETGADTTLAASFPVCYALNTGQKSAEGDNCTPECTMQNPFHVSEIKDASSWTFDFGDGRGSIPAFGHWFIRLDLSKSFPDNPKVASNRSIGIHGSTGNEASIPGRDSHGCIRLLDQDLETLHDNYIGVGTTVVVKSFTTPKLPFELKAERALGENYRAALITNEKDVWYKGE